MSKTSFWTYLLIGGCALSACGKGEEESELALESAEPATTTDGADLAVWDIRFDDPASDAGSFQMAELPGGGWSVKTGANGAAVTWRPQDVVESGTFEATATFEEHAAPADHREGYGLILGGRNLQAPDQSYTYFLVRGSGDFLIKRREGEATPTLVDWKPSTAIAKVANAGDVTRNTLTVEVGPNTTLFAVNGAAVATLTTEEAKPYGLVGLRINHALDVRVTNFAVSGATAQGTAPAAAPR